MSKTDSQDSPAGLPTDPIEFLAMTEISIIAQLTDTLFSRVLPEGLTVAQFGILNHLIRLDTQETISELASALQVSQPTMSSTVRKLKEKAYIDFASVPDDQRVKKVCVTEAGKRIRSLAVNNAAPLRAKLARQLSRSQWTQLLPILTQLRMTLDADRKPSP